MEGLLGVAGGQGRSGRISHTGAHREIKEELDAEIRIDKFLHTVEWDYPDFHLTMHCYMCSPVTDALHLNEHEAAMWLSAGNLRTVGWLPADEILLPMIEEELGGRNPGKEDAPVA